MINPHTQHGGVILCLDDDVNGLAARKEVLASAGFDVLAACEPTEAFEVLKSRKVDLVISDHFLKGTTGTELSKAFKSIQPTVPILILSGSIHRLDDLGEADEFMHKTDGPRALIEIAHRMIATSR
jgi:PleD family two-component response regulator